MTLCLILASRPFMDSYPKTVVLVRGLTPNTPIIEWIIYGKRNLIYVWNLD